MVPTNFMDLLVGNKDKENEGDALESLWREKYFKLC